MNVTKLFGAVLLVVGVLIMFFSLAYSYLIFTGSADPAELFSAPEQKEQAPTAFGGARSEVELQEQALSLFAEQFQDAIPEDTIPQMLNLFAWSMLAGLLVFGGAQVAGVGVKLIK